jgi:hypothetical protein
VLAKAMRNIKKYRNATSLNDKRLTLGTTTERSYTKNICTNVVLSLWMHSLRPETFVSFT